MRDIWGVADEVNRGLTTPLTDKHAITLAKNVKRDKSTPLTIQKEHQKIKFSAGCSCNILQFYAFVHLNDIKGGI